MATWLNFLSLGKNKQIKTLQKSRITSRIRGLLAGISDLIDRLINGCPINIGIPKKNERSIKEWPRKEIIILKIPAYKNPQRKHTATKLTKTQSIDTKRLTSQDTIKAESIIDHFNANTTRWIFSSKTKVTRNQAWFHTWTLGSTNKLGCLWLPLSSDT